MAGSSKRPGAKAAEAVPHAARGMRSMTGFGHAQRRDRGILVDVELKCVNHRFLDVSCKLPRVYSALETEIRSIVAAHLVRGRVEVFVGRTVEAHAHAAVQFDKVLLEHLYRMELETLQALGVLSPLSPDREAELKAGLVRDLFRRQDVLSVPDVSADESGERALLIATLEEAVAVVAGMQRSEGEHLAQDMRRRIVNLEGLKGQVQARASAVHAALRSKLLERVKKLAPEVVLDEARVAAEIVLIADRSDITEELVRLDSHLTQFRDALEREPSGKRFDFLLQEIHREFNTIGSKAQDAALQQVMIDAKIEIEKLREQVQNIA